MRYTRIVSPQMTSESSFGFIRTTPNYPTLNQTQPGMNFADGLFESFNSAAGSVMGVFTNLFRPDRISPMCMASTLSNGAPKRALTATPRFLG